VNIDKLAPWFHDLVSLSDAAAIMNVDPSAIRHAIARGSYGLIEGQHYMKYGKQWVLHKSAIEAMTGSSEDWQAVQEPDCRATPETPDQNTADLDSDISPDNVTFWPMEGTTTAGTFPESNQKFKIPQKYKQAIKEIYEDEDGIWCILNPGWTHIDDAHTIHCETYKELRSELTDIKQVTIP